MKKLFFAALCLTCLSAYSLHAQKEGAKPATESTADQPGSEARIKGVGKGSPLIQRQDNEAAAPASESKAEEAAPTLAPSAPAPTAVTKPNKAQQIAPIAAPMQVASPAPAKAPAAEVAPAAVKPVTKSASKEDSK